MTFQKVHVLFLASEHKVLILLLRSGLTPESHSNVRRKPQYLISLHTMRVFVYTSICIFTLGLIQINPINIV